MPNSWRLPLQAALLVTCAGLIILLSPPPPQSQRSQICASVADVGEYAHIIVNCDAPSFEELAREPWRVLEKNSVRQTRPGYAALGWIFALPFRWLPGLDHVLPPPLSDPYYGGYVALNWIILALAAMLLAELVRARSLLAPAVIVPTAVLLVNHITKGFFWTPHEQLFGLFVPMLSMWSARRFISSEALLTPRRALGVGLLTGTACLIYGSFILLPATMTIAAFVFRRKASALRPMVLMWIGVVVPLAAWHSFVMRTTGSFYSHETEHYHEFVWIAEQWRAGQLWSALGSNIVKFAHTIPRALGLPIAFVFAALALAVSRQKLIAKEVWLDPSARAAIAFSIAGLLFYVLMGFYDPRLTAIFIAPLIVLTGIASKKSFDSAVTVHPLIPEPITLAAAAYVAIVIMIPGPYA